MTAPVSLGVLCLAALISAFDMTVTTLASLLCGVIEGRISAGELIAILSTGGRHRSSVGGTTGRPSVQPWS